MKRAKTPTREQKIIMHNNNLNPDSWRVIKDDDSYLYLISKTGKQRRTVSKYGNKRNLKPYKPNK